MKCERPTGIVAVMVALHVAVVSFVFGLRHLGRLLPAT
jgi:hypothetical protein